MNALQKVFDYQGAQMRTVIQDGEPWFVAKDVCEYFRDTNYRRSISRLDDDEKGVSQIDTPGGCQEMVIINEPGLYSLLFYMQPQKGNSSEEKIQERIAALKTFKRWVTHEVLPAIRQTGAYISPTADLDVLAGIIQAMKVDRQKLVEIESTVNEAKTLATNAHHRIEILDSIDTIGDPQQRLNAMVRRYAQQEGLAFPKAWRDFVQAYNTAYHTNLTMLKENYREKKGKNKMTYPEYLAQAEKLEDALRVADKMLNRAS